MKKNEVGLVWALSSLMALCVAFAPVQAGESAPHRVLFIGNSYTYYNNMPQMFRALAEASGVAAVEVTMLVEGGRTLAEAWGEPSVQQVLSEHAWDIVVLQEQSALGTSFFVDGKQFIPDAGTLPPAAESFAAAIRAAGGKALLLSHWPRREASARDRRVLRAALCTTAKANGIRLAPIGRAWALAEAAGLPATLYDPDGSHPSAHGSYLTALTLLSTLGFEPSEKLPGTVRGAAVDASTGQVQAGEPVTLIELEPREIAQLREAAVKARADAACETMSQMPPAPTAAALPAGAPVMAADLLGTWSGGTLLYPRSMLPSPGRLSITFTRGDDGLRAAVHVTFDGVSFEERARDMPVSVNGREIRFTNPDAISDGRIAYHARMTTEGQLSGLAELVADDPTLMLVGSFSARKIPPPQP